MPDITNDVRQAGAVRLLLPITLTSCALILAACASIEPAPAATSSPGTADPVSTTTAPLSETTAASAPTTSAGVVADRTSSTAPPTSPPPLAPLVGLALDEIGTEFRQPVFLAQPRGDDRLFVVERGGTVMAVAADGTVDDVPFLDLTELVSANGIEQGLLGLAFHPDFSDNGRLFAYYTDAAANSHLIGLTANLDRTRVDPATVVPMIDFDQHIDRHYAGMLQFGPDGYLYIATGDGGKASLHGQFPETLLSAILRIDVDSADPYAVPPDNPFVEGGGAPEVWAYGLRNPWRFDIDAESGLIYIGDVGQERYEEIDVAELAPLGHNFGWLPMEGSHCFTRECDDANPLLPAVEYGRDDGCSVTGGVVYRGSLMPELDGHYFYSDWCRGWIRSFHYVDGTVVEERDWSDGFPGLTQVNSFATDQSGEMYLLTFGGLVARIVPVRE